MYEKLMERLKNPTEAQKAQSVIWVKKNMNRAGRMTEELFEKVLTFVIKHDIIDEEYLNYNTNKDISSQEFMEVFNYINELFPTKTDTSKGFPTDEVAFEYKGKTFIWCLMIGQGSSCSIRVAKEDDIGIVKYGIASIDNNLGYRINPLRVNDKGERIK